MGARRGWTELAAPVGVSGAAGCAFTRKKKTLPLGCAVSRLGAERKVLPEFAGAAAAVSRVQESLISHS